MCRHGRGRRGNLGNSRNMIFSKNDPNRQVDVCFPLSVQEKRIDMEMIKTLLTSYDINIEKILNESENEYFHRGTIQLERLTGIGFCLSK